MCDLGLSNVVQVSEEREQDVNHDQTDRQGTPKYRAPEQVKFDVFFSILTFLKQLYFSFWLEIRPNKGNYVVLKACWQYTRSNKVDIFTLGLICAELCVPMANYEAIEVIFHSNSLLRNAFHTGF